MEANDASLVSGDATSRAQELRASLGARQDAEALLAEAGRIRQQAASAADLLVAEAQQLSEQLVAESRQAAEQLLAESRQAADRMTAEAREQAEGILGRARTEAEEVTGQARATANSLRAAAEAEVEEHRRRVRAEVTAQVTADLTEQRRAAEAAAREQSEALISDLEASVRILGVSLEAARSNVTELLGALDTLRTTTDPATDPATGPATGPTDAPAARAGDDRPPQAPSPTDGGTRLVDTPFGLEPATPTGVPSPASPFGTPEGEPAGDPDRPRSATEAFLSSSSMEIEQASRELRDLQHPEDARRRRGDESRLAAQRAELEAGAPVDEDAEPGDPASRPLGWLFRSAQ